MTTLNTRKFCKLLGLGAVGVTAGIIGNLVIRKHYTEVKDDEWIFKYHHNGKVVWGVTQGGEFYINDYLETNPHIIAKKLVTDVMWFSKELTPLALCKNVVYYSLLIQSDIVIGKTLLTLKADGDISIKGKYVGNYKKYFRYV